MREAHATQGQKAHRYGRCRTHCRQYVWDTLPAGCLDIRRLLWWGASVRETGATSLLGGMTPSTVWRSSAFDEPRDTSDVSSRPRYARSWYDRPCKKQHGWPRIPFLLCQRDRHPPSRLLFRGLLSAPHDIRLCSARLPQTHDRLLSSDSLFHLCRQTSPIFCPRHGPTQASYAGVQPASASRASSGSLDSCSRRTKTAQPTVQQEHTAGWGSLVHG